MPPPAEHRGRAALLALAAIVMATTQDAIVKSMSGSYPAWETVVIRCCASLPILLVWIHYSHGFAALRTPHLRLILLRSAILCSAYYAFILAIAAMPLANAVSIYFTMPFFVAALAGPLLHERVPPHRLAAIIVGFCGVIVMERPGFKALEPGALLALYSAAGYAVGQMLGRKLAGVTPPIVIANYQNAIYLLVSLLLGLAVQGFGLQSESSKALAFLTRAWVWPSPADFGILLVMGALAAVAMLCFINAYSLAASSFVAPFEYSAMIWAVLYGFFLFGDTPDLLHLAGMAIVVGAGLYMTVKDTRPHSG